MNIKIVVIILCLLLLSKLLLTIWVYKDAQSRNLEPISWAALVFFFSSLLVFLLYLLVFRKTKMLQCNSCDYKQQAGIPFCGNCGNEIPITTSDDYTSSFGNKFLLTLSITLAIIGLVIGVIFTIGQIKHDLPENLSIAIIQNETKISKKWNASFQMRNGTKSHRFKVKENNFLDASWDIEKGDIEVVLKSGDKIIREFSSLDKQQFDELIDLKDYSGEKVVLTIKCNKASGNFKFSLKQY